MALQTSGQIKISEIANELGIFLSDISLDGMDNNSLGRTGGNKNMSGFYGYNNLTFPYLEYSEDFDSVGYQAQGNFSFTTSSGTFTSYGLYVNFGFSNSGYLKVGFNTTGDYLEIPEFWAPAQLTFWSRLSSPGNATLTHQVYKNSTWVDINRIEMANHTYEQFTSIYNPPSNEFAKTRLILEEYLGASIFFDDLEVYSSVP